MARLGSGMEFPKIAARLMTPTWRVRVGRSCSFRAAPYSLKERMNPQFILAVAIGGGVGTVARYFVGIETGRLLGTDFPWGTLIINITASFLIGAFAGLFAHKWALSQATRIFLTVGFCGGFSTFSTFTLDAWYLVQRGQVVAAIMYMIASAAFSTAALVAALHLTRALT